MDMLNPVKNVLADISSESNSPVISTSTFRWYNLYLFTNFDCEIRTSFGVQGLPSESCRTATAIIHPWTVLAAMLKMGQA